MAYLYIKKADRSPRRRSSVNSVRRRVVAFLLFFLGFIFLASAVFPILQFQLSYAGRFREIINPLSSNFYNQSSNVLGDIDYTQLNNWFVNASSNQTDFSPASPSNTYYLSIPKLKIENATVEIGSLDLKRSLIQYPQTALPGQFGNPVIFGHSVLPQFFNPKSYLTIFSTLYKLKQGDEIFIDFDRVRYKYLIEEMYEVPPSDLSVLEQRFDGRFLTLITCSPPGTYLRRLIIKGRIADI